MCFSLNDPWVDIRVYVLILYVAVHSPLYVAVHGDFCSYHDVISLLVVHLQQTDAIVSVQDCSVLPGQHQTGSEVVLRELGTVEEFLLVPLRPGKETYLF